MLSFVATTLRATPRGSAADLGRQLYVEQDRAIRDPAIAQLGLPITRVSGELHSAILRVANERRACLIVMPTQGHDSIGDVLLGSHTEHAIRDAECPVLSVPS